MDGIGELAEYIRTNLNWQIWCKNFKIYVDNFKNLDNCEFSVMTTISIYNIHKFLDINQFFMQNFKMAPSINFVYGPKPESAAFNLSDENKKYIINLYKNSNVFDQISNFLNSNKATMFCDHIVKLIDRRDNAVMNGQLYKNFKPFREVEPEWYDRLKNF